jgi:ribosomal protein S18 acetylase RimI-like enzyme
LSHEQAARLLQVLVEMKRVPATRWKIVDPAQLSLPETDLMTHIRPWVTEAANPYLTCLCGGVSEATSFIRDALSRSSSELWIGRARLMTDAEIPVGGYIALAGEELVSCRQADLFALLKRATPEGRAAVRVFLEQTKSLFTPVPPGVTYLSKIGVIPSARRQGLASRLLEDWLHRGAEAGINDFQLDVASENRGAIALYRRYGFEVLGQCESPAYDLHYLTMAKRGALMRS